jgi:hypothetical protein
MLVEFTREMPDYRHGNRILPQDRHRDGRSSDEGAGKPRATRTPKTNRQLASRTAAKGKSASTYFRALVSIVFAFASRPPHVAATAPINKAAKLAREKSATAVWAASEVSCGRSVNVGIGAVWRSQGQVDG